MMSKDANCRGICENTGEFTMIFVRRKQTVLELLNKKDGSKRRFKRTTDSRSQLCSKFEINLKLFGETRINSKQSCEFHGRIT